MLRDEEDERVEGGFEIVILHRLRRLLRAKGLVYRYKCFRSMRNSEYERLVMKGPVIDPMELMETEEFSMQLSCWDNWIEYFIRSFSIETPCSGKATA
jgi:hypothetical protein